MAIKYAFAVGLLCVSTTSVALAQKSQVKTPTLSKDFVEQLRAPGAVDLRIRTLLIQELEGLERLLRVTPKKSPDRPRLLRRLAEGYAELAALAARDKTVADERLRRAKQAR
jgi:hypothetical protein